MDVKSHDNMAWGLHEIYSLGYADLLRCLISLDSKTFLCHTCGPFHLGSAGLTIDKTKTAITKVKPLKAYHHGIFTRVALVQKTFYAYLTFK